MACILFTAKAVGRPKTPLLRKTYILTAVPLVRRMFIGQEKREEREGESQAIGRTGLLVADAGRFLHS